MTFPPEQLEALSPVTSWVPGQLAKEEFEEIVGSFQDLYKKLLRFTIDWDSIEGNCRALPSREIVLEWAAARRVHVGRECLLFIICHEIAHFDGVGMHDTDSKLLCEGYADFEGMRRILPHVCKEFGDAYEDVAPEAIAQFARVLRVSNSEIVPPDKITTCAQHPSPECRIATMHAAFAKKQTIPVCARVT